MRANLLPKSRSARGPLLRKALIGVGIGVGVLAFLVLFTPLGGVLAGAADSAAGGEVRYQRRYAGAIAEARNSAELAVGDRCDLLLRLEDRLFGEMLRLELSCGGRGLYGQRDDLGWIAESEKRDGEVVHALDQWDDEGDPGIEFARDQGTVTYWEQSGLRLTIALDSLPRGRLPAEYEPGAVPAERPATAPSVSEKCEPGRVCWAPRMDVRF